MRILRAQFGGQSFYAQLRKNEVHRIDGLPYDEITYTGDVIATASGR